MAAPSSAPPSRRPALYLPSAECIARSKWESEHKPGNETRSCQICPEQEAGWETGRRA